MRTVLVLTLIFAVAEAKFADASDTNLLIKTTQLTPELVLAVAKVGQEKTVLAETGADILKIVSRYCGSSNVRRYYLPLFLAANGDNPDIAAKKTILSQNATLKLPACLYADETLATVSVATGGPKWDLPMAFNIEALKEPSRDVARSPVLLPHQPGSGKLAEGSEATIGSMWKPVPGWPSLTKNAATYARLAGQGVDYNRLISKEITLPRSIAKTGPGLVMMTFDSTRLSDPILATDYDRLVDAALNRKKADGAPAKLDPEVAMRASSFERSVRTQDILTSNTKIDFAKLQPDSKIVTSSFASGAYAITLKPGIDPSEATKTIEVATRTIAGSKAVPIGDYVPELDDPLVYSHDPGCVVSNGQKWPYDFDELQRVLDLRRRIHQPAVAGKFLILDTGFPPEQIDTPPFDRRYFVSDGDPGDVHSYVRSGLPDDYYFEKAKGGSHGVAVITLALGGVDALKSNTMFDLVQRNNGQIVSLMGYKPVGNNQLNLDVIGEKVGPALAGSDYAWSSTNFTGINLSMRFRTSKSEFASFFQQNSQVVYVFAAGNRRPPDDNLMLSQDQPAVLGGPTVSNVIIVGGITPKDGYWTSSSWNAAFVDIAAPACAVPTYVWDSASKHFEVKSLDGTSFAAPLVSFTANLIRGDNAPGYKIKSRIVGSARHVASLEAKVNGGRVLDISVTAAIDFDAVRMRDGNLRLGSIDWGAGKSVCGKNFKRQELAQIQRRDKDDNSLQIAIRQGQHVAFLPCQMQNEYLTDLNFRPIEADGASAKFGKSERLDFTDVRSITLCDACYRGP